MSRDKKTTDLAKLVQSYIDERCDELGIPKFNSWKSILDSYINGELDEVSFRVLKEQFRLRANLRSTLSLRRFFGSDQNKP